MRVAYFRATLIRRLPMDRADIIYFASIDV